VALYFPRAFAADFDFSGQLPPSKGVRGGQAVAPMNTLPRALDGASHQAALSAGEAKASERTYYQMNKPTIYLENQLY
jgi:hypothetical protein